MNISGLIKISKDELTLSLFLIIAVLFAPSEYLIFFPLLVLIVFLFLGYKEKFLLVFTIITFLTVTTTISPVLRNLIQVSNLSLLVFLFFKHHGFNFREYPSIPVSIVLYFIILLCLMILSSFNSNLLLGLEQVVRLTIFLFIVYFYYSIIKNDGKNYKLIVKSFFIIALIYGCYLMYEFASSDFNIIQYNLRQVTAIGNDYLPKNQMGGFFSIIIILSISYLFYLKSKKVKYFLISIIFFSILSLMLLNSRASILGVFIGFIFVSYFFNKKLIIRTLIVLSSCALLLLINPVYEIVEIYFRFDQVSTGRDYILSATASVIKENWILGAGPAGTKSELYRNLPYMLNSPIEEFLRFHYNQIEFGHAHNFYLFFFSDLGIAGLILSLLLPVLFFKYGYKALMNIKRNSFEYYTIVGIMGSGLCLFFRGLFEWGSLISYGTINLDLPFWLIFIILIYFYMNNYRGAISATLK